MSARIPYCVAKGCNDLPPVEHLESHLRWGCTGPEHMAGLLAAYDALKRAEVLAEAADAIDEVADAAEEDAIASDGYAYGRSNRTVAVHREDAALLRRLAAAPTTPTTKES